MYAVEADRGLRNAPLTCSARTSQTCPGRSPSSTPPRQFTESHDADLTFRVTNLCSVAWRSWGHVRTLAVAMAEAARATGATVDIYRFPELLSDEIRTNMYAVPHDEAHKEITPEVFATYDGKQAVPHPVLASCTAR